MRFHSFSPPFFLQSYTRVIVSCATAAVTALTKLSMNNDCNRTAKNSAVAQVVFFSPRQWKSSPASRQRAASSVATATHIYVSNRSKVALLSILQYVETYVEH